MFKYNIVFQIFGDVIKIYFLSTKIVQPKDLNISFKIRWLKGFLFFNKRGCLDEKRGEV